MISQLKWSEEIEKVQPGSETEITEMEDGSVDVNFDPESLQTITSN